MSKFFRHRPFIKETSTSTGVGDMILNGAVDSDHETFNGNILTGKEVIYTCKFTGGFFVARGTYFSAANKVTRAEILFSSESGDANPTVPAGTSTIYIAPVPGFYTGAVDHYANFDERVNIKSYNQEYYDSPSFGGIINLDLNQSCKFKTTLTENVTKIQMTGTVVNGMEVELHIIQDSGALYTAAIGVGIPGFVINSNGEHSASGIAANKKFIYRFLRIAGTWYADTYF